MTDTTDPMRVWLTRLSLGAGIAFTASAEYQLAVTLGAGVIVAAMLPVAIDAYVVAALRWFGSFDIALSLALMGAAQVAAHLLDAGVVQVDILLVTVVSLLVPVAIWRTHALARRGELTSSTAGGSQDVAAPVAVLVQRADVRPVIKVPQPVPHDAIDKGYKPRPLALPAPPAEPEPELTAIGFLARMHKVRPEQIRTVADLLDSAPTLTGKAAAAALGTGDSYGRRVLRAAKELGGVRA